MNEHAARAAGRIEDCAVIGLDHFDDQLHNGRGREVLAPLLHEGRRELAHEVLEDQPVSVALDLERRKQPQQLPQRVVGQPRVALRQHAREIGVGLGDSLHRGVQLRPEVGRPRQRQQPREAGVLRQKDRPAGLIVTRLRLEPARELWGKLGVNRLELRLHLAQRDQRENGLGVLIRA